MKIILSSILAFCFVMSSAFAQDMLLYTKLETKWNEFLLQKFRQVMQNFDVNFDPQQLSLEEGFVYDESVLREFLNKDSIELITKIQKAAGFEILGAVPEFELENISYKINKITPHVTLGQTSVNDTIFKTQLSIQGIQVKAEKFDIRFVIKTLTGQDIPTMNISVINPKIIIPDTLVVEAGLDITTILRNGKLKLDVHNLRLEKLSKFLNDNRDKIILDYDRLELPEVSLSLAGRNIIVDTDKVKRMLEDNKSAIQDVISSQLAHSLSDSSSLLALFDDLKNVEFTPSDFFNTATEDTLITQMGITSIERHAYNILKMEISNDYCTVDDYRLFSENCIFTPSRAPVLSQISESNKAYSRSYIDELLKVNENQLIVSVDENYVNKLVNATISAGFWDEALATQGLTLGPKGAFVKFTQKGRTAKLYIDAIYTLTRMQGRLIGESQLRIPLVMDVTIRVETQEESTINNLGQTITERVPKIIFNVQDVDDSFNTIMFGVPSVGLEGNAGDARFKKKIYKMISGMLDDFKKPYGVTTHAGVDIEGIVFPEVKKLNIEDMELLVDGHGRANAIMKSDVLNKK